jgi:hypothetical protein
MLKLLQLGNKRSNICKVTYLRVIKMHKEQSIDFRRVSHSVLQIMDRKTYPEV